MWLACMRHARAALITSMHGSQCARTRADSTTSLLPPLAILHFVLLSSPHGHVPYASGLAGIQEPGRPDMI